eukprot:CAMPEP_0170652854 /NCGR_PEP_ID=MMETSP0224-20130122/47111_1 /TAXON_ID=285029 /ORGANISM="Togula jolla, Strain CCCM 725" /LENGTH=180 /DNA_ID=CAMNT_0010984717 /DNA_START=9 /DNA_END=548 /DNA_ORIENTATION=+
MVLACRLAMGICAGLEYLHARSLVHADLKSSNILINYSSGSSLVPKICDFGHVAVRTHPLPHRRCGTPHWAAPEALRHTLGNADAASPSLRPHFRASHRGCRLGRLDSRHGALVRGTPIPPGVAETLPELRACPEAVSEGIQVAASWDVSTCTDHSPGHACRLFWQRLTSLSWQGALGML